jgi:DNA-binding transcriptional MerR regulator
MQFHEKRIYVLTAVALLARRGGERRFDKRYVEEHVIEFMQSYGFGAEEVKEVLKHCGRDDDFFEECLEGSKTCILRPYTANVNFLKLAEKDSVGNDRVERRSLARRMRQFLERNTSVEEQRSKRSGW